jgi:hypothetical protein
MEAARFPLSFAQESFVTYYPMLADPRIQHCATVLRVAGATDRARLKRALTALESRHGVLCARYVRDEAGRTAMVLDSALHVDFEWHERPHGSSDAWESQLLREVHARRFDLESGPLVRLCFISTAAGTGVLLVVMHHSIADAWSVFVFLSELRAIYQALGKGMEPELKPLSLQYTDYVQSLRAWVASDKAHQLMQELRAELLGAAEPFYLPADDCSSQPQTVSRSAPRYRLSAEVSRQLTKRAKEQGVNAFSMCLAAFALALARWSERPEVFVSIIHTGRTRPEQFNLIGSLVELWLMRLHLSVPFAFADALKAVNRARVHGRKYEVLPYWKIREQLASACPDSSRLDVAFNFISSVAAEKTINDADASSADWKLEIDENALGEPEEGMQPESGLKLYFAVWETRRGLEWTAQYNQMLFRRSTIEALCADVGAILSEAVARDEPSDRRVSVASAVSD